RVRCRICIASCCGQNPPTDPRISNRGSLFGKRGSRIHGQPYLYSPLPFPDWMDIAWEFLRL
ncbi:hypothetical protein N9F52_02930, partial [Akkermansiaceae bacterium]|nr:hypothetical protein [Akkermansiaceae bacterium]